MKIARSIASLTLAFLVLVSSTGVSVHMHVCGGEVQSVAIFSKAESCMKMEQKPCHGLSIQQMMKGCCEDKSVMVKGKETNAEVKTATEVAPVFQASAVILPVLCSINNVRSSDAYSFQRGYSPPLIEQDITILVQSFLI